MHLSKLNVLVVGAATGGAATALLLARAGAHVTVIDKIEAATPIGAGLALAANGRAVLDALGLGPALGDACELPGVRVTDARGRTLAAPPDGARMAVVTRARLQALFVDALLAEPRITVRFGTSLLHARRDGTVTLASPHGEAIERYDLVVGADGVHSRVREGGTFGTRIQRTGIRYLRALVAERVPHGTEAWTAEGVFGAVPVEGGSYIFASCASSALAAAIEQSDLDALREAWQAAYPPAGRLLGAVQHFDDLLIHEVVRVDCERWHDQRLVLVGDAAHAMAPNLGQGANSALVDAVVLVHALRSAPDLESGLATYAARRQRPVRAVADAAARIGRASEKTHPLMRALRDRVLLPLASLLPAQRQLRMLLQESPELLRAMTRADRPVEERPTVIVLGASGGCGQWVVRLAAARGWHVIAVVRPGTSVAFPAGVEVRFGDVTDVRFLDELMVGATGVISALGLRRAGRSPWARLRSPSNLMSTVAEKLVQVMTWHGVRRLVAISAGGVGTSHAQLTAPVRTLIGRGNIAVAYRDLEAMEARLTRSALDWTVVRPVTLTDGGPTFRAGVVARYSLTSVVRRADVAAYLVDALLANEGTRERSVLLGGRDANPAF